MCHILIDGTYQIQCSYETVVRFFHKQGDALKMPQPWPDKQDEQLREAFLQKLEQLATDVFAALFARSQPHRAHLANDESTRVQQLRL